MQVGLVAHVHKDLSLCCDCKYQKKKIMTPKRFIFLLSVSSSAPWKSQGHRQNKKIGGQDKKKLLKNINSYLIKNIKLNKCMNIEHQFSFCDSVRSVSLKFPKILHQLEMQLTKSLAIAFKSRSFVTNHY